jgi:hypothetical protein
MKFQPGDIVRLVGGLFTAKVVDVSPYNGVGLDQRLGNFSRYHEGDLELVLRLGGTMEWTEEDDAYVKQTARQNQGLPCSDCGSHKGHFNFCNVLGGNGDNTITSDWYDRPYTQSERSFEESYNRLAKAAEQAKPYMRPKDFVPEFDVADEHWLNAMGIKLHD